VDNARITQKEVDQKMQKQILKTVVALLSLVVAGCAGEVENLKKDSFRYRPLERLESINERAESTGSL